MCGIAGIVGPQASESDVGAMIRAIVHRGPDGDSLDCGPGVAFGHARLAIIDLVTGAQPMRSASGRWLIVFNGEIYNYRELRAQLESRYAFATHSDTEVILAAVEVHGVERGLAMIDGMFAIGLYDMTERRVHLARDHFGIKPLYWANRDDGALVFASEMKALHAAGVAMPIDRTAIAVQLLCRFIPAPWTGRVGVHKLRPGEHLVFDADGRRLGESRRIVPLAASASPAAGRDRVEQVAALMSDAVQRQTVSDVPIGILLSGGIDSALVCQSAARANPGLHSYCVGYSADDRATEFAEAEETARLVGTAHRNIVVEPEDFAGAVRHSIWHLEEPVATTSLVTFSLLCKAVAKERKVVLTGQGADEPWAGYTRHRFEALRGRYGPAMSLAAPLIRRWAVGRARLREIVAHLDDDLLRWVAYRSLFPIERVGQVFGDDVLRAALERIRDALAWADGQAPEAAADPFNRLLVRDAFTDLSDNLLLLSDKLSMSHGLEVRVPLLDVAYASHVLRLPRDAKRTGPTFARGKALHKAVASRTLPPQIVHRPKKGFETPLQRWLEGDFGREVRAKILGPSSGLAACFDVQALLGDSPALANVSHELQQQLFSLWLTEEWTHILK